jgi:hypothetical protein
VACPFSRPESVKPQLRDKDWTRYGGYLHADHSIRSEFFHNNPEPLPDIENKKYRQDLTYLYDPKSKDHVRFITGTNVSEEEVWNALGGPPETWPKIMGSSGRISPIAGSKEAQVGTALGDDERIIAELLAKGREWQLSAEQLGEMQL